MDDAQTMALQEPAQGFVTYCALPIVVLCLIGLLCHHIVGTRHQGFYGESGYRLRHVVGWSLAVGIVVGVGLAQPLLTYETKIIVGALGFGIAAAQLTWGARECISAAFLSAAGLMLGSSSAYLAMRLVLSPTIDTQLLDQLRINLLGLWPAFALPALVTAGIAAFLTIQSERATRSRT